MPAWGGAERLTALVGRGRALLLAGAGIVLDAAEAQRAGLVDQVLPRESFEEGWRSVARSLATTPAQEIKRITATDVSADEAVRAFARLWVSDEHWEATERVMIRGK